MNGNMPPGTPSQWKGRESIHIWGSLDESNLQVCNACCCNWCGIDLNCDAACLCCAIERECLCCEERYCLKADLDLFPFACDPCCDSSCSQGGYCWTWSCGVFQCSWKKPDACCSSRENCLCVQSECQFPPTANFPSACVYCHGLCYCYPSCGICPTLARIKEDSGITPLANQAHNNTGVALPPQQVQIVQQNVQTAQPAHARAPPPPGIAQPAVPVSAYPQPPQPQKS